MPEGRLQGSDSASKIMNKCFFYDFEGVRLSKGGTSEQLCFRDLRSEKDIRSIGQKK